MKKKKWCLFPLITLLVIFLLPQLSNSSSKDLPKKHKKWLEEDAAYIITPKEKEVFLQLETDKERDLFIDAFWKHRNPTPGTPENEYKQEHYKRIEHANHKFGVGSPKPGWKTDRGKIYIILGEPHSIESYSSLRELRDTEIWFYQGLTKYGLPTAFYVVFYRKGIASDFEFYSPVADGPYSLFIRPPNVDPADYVASYEALKNINSAIAEVSLSLIPGDLSIESGRPSLVSELLLQNIALKPQKEVNDLYAEKWLKYKSIVEVDYTANYINSDYLIQSIRDKSGQFFVHYLVIPERLSVGQYGNKYYVNFLLNGQVKDLEGRTVYQFEKEYPVNFDENRVQVMSSTPFQINDMFPLIPGTYQFSLLLKNTVSKEFSSFEAKVIIPGKVTDPAMSPLLFCYNSKEMKDSLSLARPFQINGNLLFCEPAALFLPSDSLTVFFQLYGMSPELQKSGEIHFSISKGEETVSSYSRPVSEYKDPVNIIEKIPLVSYIPADYTLKVSVQDQSGEDVVTQSKVFSLTPMANLPRPFITAKALPVSNEALNEYSIGTQLKNSENYEEAVHHLEMALQEKPNDLDFAISLAQTYFALKKYYEIDAVLTPFLDRDDVRYEVYFTLGRSAQARSDYASAIHLYREAISHFGLNTNLLNLIGECYFQLKNFSEARAAWEKSLEINPDQLQIQKNLNSLKEESQ